MQFGVKRDDMWSLFSPKKQNRLLREIHSLQPCAEVGKHLLMELEVLPVAPSVSSRGIDMQAGGYAFFFQCEVIADSVVGRYGSIIVGKKYDGR